MLLPIAIALYLGIGLPHAYASYAIPPVTLTQATAKSIDGTATLTWLNAGQQILIETNVTNTSIKLGKPLVAAIEVRDTDGKTMQFGWQSVNLGVGDKAEIGMSWLVPDNAQSGDIYIIRCFAADSFTDHAQALSNVYETKVNVG